MPCWSRRERRVLVRATLSQSSLECFQHFRGFASTRSCPEPEEATRTAPATALASCPSSSFADRIGLHAVAALSSGNNRKRVGSDAQGFRSSGPGAGERGRRPHLWYPRRGKSRRCRVAADIEDRACPHAP